MRHDEKAKELFMNGYNCAQSVLCAFDDVTGLDPTTAAKISLSFGAGMGRMREVCGAVSGALMVLGLVKGYDDPKAISKKNDHYKMIQDFASRFRAENGSIICRDLLEGVEVTPGPEAEKRTEQYYNKRPCPELVACAARILDDFIEPTVKIR